MVSSATADFSEVQSSSDVDNWRELCLLPLYRRIAPVESDGVWFPLGGCPLVLGQVAGGVTLRALAFLRRDSHMNSAAIRARTTTPPTTPPAMAPFCTVGVGVVMNGVFVGDTA